MLNQIKDMLCRIKNGQNLYKQKVCLHKNVNKNCIQILRLLEKEGFISGFVVEKSPFNVYVLLKYNLNGVPAIRYISNISAPGLRLTGKLNSVWTVNSGFGVLVLSTTKGFMTLADARKKQVGGQLEFIIS